MIIKDIAQYEDSDSQLAKKTILDLTQEIQQLKAKLEMYENGVYYSSENDKLKEVINELNEALNHIDDNIMKSCKNYDVNGIELKKILDKVKEIK